MVNLYSLFKFLDIQNQLTLSQSICQRCKKHQAKLKISEYLVYEKILYNTEPFLARSSNLLLT